MQPPVLRRNGAADLADEAKALSRDGADHRLILAAVADRFSRGVDAARQRRVGDDAAVPDGLDQVILGDDAVTVLDQVNQEIKHLRLDRDGLAAAGQFAQGSVKHMVGKVKLQVFVPTSVLLRAFAVRVGITSSKIALTVRYVTEKSGCPQGKISPLSELFTAGTRSPPYRFV